MQMDKVYSRAYSQAHEFVDDYEDQNDIDLSDEQKSEVVDAFVVSFINTVGDGAWDTLEFTMEASQDPKGAGKAVLKNLKETGKDAYDIAEYTVKDPKGAYNNVNESVENFNNLSAEEQAAIAGSLFGEIVQGGRTKLLRGKGSNSDHDSSGSDNEGAGDARKVNYGEQYTKVNGKKALKPDVEYTTNEGYRYTTDSHRRISSAEANLQLGKADRNQYAQRTAGGEDRLTTDDGGHLIASIFKGSGEIDNLVPMNSTLNGSEYKTLENTWKGALEAGKTVEVKIEPIYGGNSVRPSKFEVEYKIDGKKYEVNLTNYEGGQ